MLFKKINIFFVIFVTVTMIACASKGVSKPEVDSDSAARARMAAERNFAEMEGRPTNLSGQPLTQTNPSSTTGRAQQRMQSAGKPTWVDYPEMDYSRARYVTGVGNGTSRDAAEKNALANLTAYFGVSIQSDQTVRESYHEAIQSGNMANWTKDLNIQNTVRTQTSMDALVGAEIREVWLDTADNRHYAIAVMDKTVSEKIYRDLIIANQDMIKNLLDMTPTEKNSLNGYTRYSFAAVIADMNITYGNLLNLIGSSSPIELIRGDVYRLELQNIARNVSIGINVKNDRANRIQSAIAKAIADLGFRTGGNNNQYVCQVETNISPVDLPNNPNVFVRIIVTVNLTDTTNDVVLNTWSFNDRQGHTTASEAENRAFSSAERKIAEEYKVSLSNYLSQLIPK